MLKMPVASIPCGFIQGMPASVPGSTVYKGIRYAHAGRWRYPEVVSHWDGIYQADQYGTCAFQQAAVEPEGQGKRSFYYHEFREGLSPVYGEDCLFLNIWTPAHAGHAPVIVYLHGGALLGGSSYEKPFLEPVWTKDQVIAVTINYRVGPFGFLCLPELKKEIGHTGNYGLYDQLAALRWIHENIEAFGGDPDNITLMGQSAGGNCVLHLLASPLSKGLVHKAVVLSPAGLCPVFGREYPAEHHYPFWQEWMKQVGTEDLSELRSLDAGVIQTAFQTTLNHDFQRAGSSLVPVTGDELLPVEMKEGIKAGHLGVVPCLIGCNLDDMTVDTMNREITDFAAAYPGPVTRYQFCRRLPGDDAGAFHSADLWYWFGTLEHSWRPFEDCDRMLSGQMTACLADFAHTGSIRPFPAAEDTGFFKILK